MGQDASRWQHASMDLARSVWLRVETMHAVTYFGDAPRSAASGLDGCEAHVLISARAGQLADDLARGHVAGQPTTGATATSRCIRYPNPMGLPAFRG